MVCLIAAGVRSLPMAFAVSRPTTNGVLLSGIETEVFDGIAVGKYWNTTVSHPAYRVVYEYTVGKTRYHGEQNIVGLSRSARGRMTEGAPIVVYYSRSEPSS